MGQECKVQGADRFDAPVPPGPRRSPSGALRVVCGGGGWSVVGPAVKPQVRCLHLDVMGIVEWGNYEGNGAPGFQPRPYLVLVHPPRPSCLPRLGPL